MQKKKDHLTLLHLDRPKLYAILAFLSAIGLKEVPFLGDLWKFICHVIYHKICICRPFLNNIKDNIAKNNKNAHLEAIVGAKKTASRWKDFCSNRRIRKKNSKYIFTLTDISDRN